MTRILVKNGRGYIDRQPRNLSRSLHKIYAKPWQKSDEEMQFFGCEDADERTAVEIPYSDRKLPSPDLKTNITSTDVQSKLTLSPTS